MAIIGSGIAGLAGLVNFVCFVMVLIKLFNKEGAGKAVLGFICGIYTFIWGWQNADEQQIRKIMMLWSASIGLSIVGQILAAVLS